jgi:hypothetical protein
VSSCANARTLQLEKVTTLVDDTLVFVEHAGCEPKSAASNAALARHEQQHVDDHALPREGESLSAAAVVRGGSAPLRTLSRRCLLTQRSD